MYVIKLSCVTSLLVGSILVAFGQDQSANIYSLGNPLVNADTALNVAGKLGFQLKGDPSQHQLIVDERGATRGFFMPSRRTNSFILEPNLTQGDDHGATVPDESETAAVVRDLKAGCCPLGHVSWRAGCQWRRQANNAG